MDILNNIDLTIVFRNMQEADELNLLHIANVVSTWAIPLLILVIPLVAIIKKVKVYEVFVDGAKEGFQVAVKIIPFLVAILVAIGMFRACGIMEIFYDIAGDTLIMLGIPPDIIPMSIMRPLSGSGTFGILTDIVNTHGPDSLVARIGATMYGSTETTFYVIAVYFGSVGIKKARHAIPVGLLADLVGIIASIYICNLIFS